MKNLIIIAALVASSAAPAYAISEAYRQQLQHEHKTQVSDANAPVHASKTTPVHVNNWAWTLNVALMVLHILMVALRQMMKTMLMHNPTVRV